jgi:hypothetical protein
VARIMGVTVVVDGAVVDEVRVISPTVKIEE